MEEFRSAYRRLNAAQKQAVDAIEGPVLVVAGPGTGKTQLLALRIASILQKTDTLPENILCLTFTESAVQAMRQRLTGIIGKAAYDITISTYHAFGSELLRHYPEYFTLGADMQPADDLAIDAIFRDIMANLPYTNPLRYETFLHDVRQLVSDSKRALLTPADLRTVATANDAFIAEASKLTRELSASLSRVTKKSLPVFEKLLTVSPIQLADPLPSGVTPLVTLWHDELTDALEAVHESGKTTPLSKWKLRWLAKDDTGAFVASGAEQNRRLKAGAAIYQQYLEKLSNQNLYDYDDMILRAIRGLTEHPELRFSLQERYLYLLLDEFQDTNEAQARLVELLTDNPINEGRPNVLAVGDDDQAIYAFQGANYSHMVNFYERYRDVLVVPLTENYRSHADILQTASGIVEQIDSRLHKYFPTIDKTIQASNTALPAQATIERHDFKSEVTQNAWIAQQIQTLLEHEVPASEIAVLAPKHEYLERLVPFLQHERIPLHYEKREDVLDEPAVHELLAMSRLVLSLAANDRPTSDSAWPHVLSLDFWQLPTSLVWQLSWQASDTKRAWTDILCERAETKQIALFFIRLSQLVRSDTLEQMLDKLIGLREVDLHENPSQSAYRSPFYAYYFEPLAPEGHEDTQSFWELLSNLTVLRERLRAYRSSELAPLRLDDFLAFVEANQAAGIKILNTNPYQEATSAVELMTAYRAKGQEYTAVFIMAAIDEVWGTKARALGSRLSLPPNLQFIRYAGTSEDERLRLLYVALTRAKTHLYLTAYTNTYVGKQSTRLKYLDEHEAEEGKIISPLLPIAKQVVRFEDQVTPTLDELTVQWQEKHYRAVTQPSLKSLLEPRLEAYQLNPTELNCFVDVMNDGPTTFFIQTLLRFPTASAPSAEYGSAMHETLEWIHLQQKQNGRLPTQKQTTTEFAHRLHNKRLGEPHTGLLLERGQRALEAYLVQRPETIRPEYYTEYNFRHEGVFVGSAHLSGKIDKLIVDQQAKTITIIDYKTGQSHRRWDPQPRLHFYRNQLYFYKLLVEHSHTFRGYIVTDAYLEFVEPDVQGRINELHIDFDKELMRRFEALVIAVWQHVIELRFPFVGDYSQNLKGIEAFEDDLATNSS